MRTAFDFIAADYDRVFTTSITGRYQRRSVWDYLKSTLPNNPLNILEINSGTGEDALFLASMGHRVTATDRSYEMIQETEKKLIIEMSGRVTTEVVDIQNIHHLIGNRYDVVFSDFGGLNCVSPDELKRFATVLPKLLKKNGRFIFVVMPKFCFNESLYFLIKFNFRKVFRRWANGPVKANFGKQSLPVWYYNPSFFSNLFNGKARLISGKAIGLLIPPSFLEPVASHFPGLMKYLFNIEKIFASIRALCYVSDHFLFDMEIQ